MMIEKHRNSYGFCSLRVVRDFRRRLFKDSASSLPLVFHSDGGHVREVSGKALLERMPDAKEEGDVGGSQGVVTMTLRSHMTYDWMP